MADGALAASTTQSAAESEEDLLRLHARANASPSVGAFSTSSVDQFLRDNGFQLDDDDDDDVLSSSAASTALAGGEAQRTVMVRATTAAAPASGSALDDDAAAAVEGLLRADALALTRRDRDDDNDGDGDVLSSDEGSHLSSAHVGSTAAGEEGDMPPPRFILLDDEELLSMSHEPPSSLGTPSSTAHIRASDWRRAVPSATAAESQRAARMGSSFDRSMLLGGSGLSALSEESHDSTSAQAHAVAEPARGYRRLPPRSMHQQDAQAVKTGPRASLVDRLVASSSSSSSASYASSPRALSSSTSSRESGQRDQASKRSHDDELSDALGVGSSIAQHEHHRSALDSRQRLDPRRLSPHEDEEHKETTEQRGNPMATNPWARLERPSARGDDGSDEREAQKAQWADLNILLRKNGLPTLALRDVTRGTVVPDQNSMINLVQEFLLQLGQKNEAIQDLVIDSNRTYKVQNKAEGDAVLLGKKNEELQRSLQSAQNEMKRLQGEVQRQKDETEKQTKNLKASCLKLQQQLKVSEHRVKAKEVLVERMQKKIQQQVDKENMNKTRDRKIFKQLQQRDPRKANAKDNQSLECISIYETQREQMQEEIEHLRGQVASLNGELRDKENTLSRHSSFSQASVHWSESGLSGSYHSKFDAADDMLMRLEAARREQEQAAAKLRQRETIMVKKISAIEEELLAARETIAELKDENANLTLEAESRPSIRDYRLSQRRIHQLERQLSEQKLALEEANDINELRRFMGTTELIERDRLNHRLHLNRLGTLPKETLLEVVKEVCRVLNLTDITLITPSLHKLCNVVTAVPRMEKFIRDVCGFVYFNVADQDNQQEDARFELEQVIPTLQQWMVERKKLFELQGFKTAVITELCKRSVEPSLLKQQPSAETESPTQLSSLPRAVHMVAELVELEKSVMHHREIYTQAAEELERRPSVLVNQIVRHFSHVFNVKQVEGVLPRINEIFLFVNEMENFLKAIRSLLVLKPSASPVVCIEAVRSLVEGENGNARAANTDEPDDAPNYVVQKSTRGPVDVASGGVAGVREVREMSVLIRDLKKELGAATMQEILPRTRRLMELLSLSIHQHQDNDDDF